MKQKVVSGILLTLLLMSMLTLGFSQAVKAEPTTITVPDDCEKIQWAIGNATDRDTIFVRAGIYYENVVVDKSLSLIGENRSTTIIDGGGTGNVVDVTSDSVNISRFTIRNSGPDYPDSGIRAHFSNGHNISNNIVTNNKYGIHLYACDRCSVYRNDANGNQIGVYLFSCHDCLVASNIANNNSNGLLLEQSFYSSAIHNNAGNNQYGITLYCSSYYSVSDNSVNDNEYGITLHCSDYCYIVGNNINNNEYGIQLDYSFEDSIHHNNIINNTNQAETISSVNIVWDDGYPSGGNYWSDYTGVDANADGIGDTPYTIDASNEDRYPLMNPWIERRVGVKVGDWAKYSVNTSWTGTLDPYLEMLSETGWAMLEVTDVQGTVITYTRTLRFKNGSELTGSDLKWGIAPTGSFGFIFFFIGSNLRAGDRVYPSGVTTINETVTGTYCGVPREVNHLEVSVSATLTPLPYDLYDFNCYWDQTTGILTEESLDMSIEDLSSMFSVHFKMVDTNLWEAPISWEHVFEDERRGTSLKINTEDKQFQFTAPDKEFSMKHDPNMFLSDHFILIYFRDSEIVLFSFAVITPRWSFCLAIARDVETGTRYLLIDLTVVRPVEPPPSVPL